MTKSVLETLILCKIGKLCVDGDLVVNDAVETTMVLLERNDPILQKAG